VVVNNHGVQLLDTVRADVPFLVGRGYQELGHVGRAAAKRTMSCYVLFCHILLYDAYGQFNYASRDLIVLISIQNYKKKFRNELIPEFFLSVKRIFQKSASARG